MVFGGLGVWPGCCVFAGLRSNGEVEMEEEVNGARKEEMLVS